MFIFLFPIPNHLYLVLALDTNPHSLNQTFGIFEEFFNSVAKEKCNVRIGMKIREN